MGDGRLREYWTYFCDDAGKPVEIGAGDVLAIHEAIHKCPNLEAAYALGWNECRKAVATLRSLAGSKDKEGRRE